METQGASLSLGRWSLWLLLLGLVVPSASAQALSYREAVLRAVGQLNERSSEANLYRLLELDLPPKQDVSWGGDWEGKGFQGRRSEFTRKMEGTRTKALTRDITPNAHTILHRRWGLPDTGRDGAIPADREQRKNCKLALYIFLNTTTNWTSRRQSP